MIRPFRGQRVAPGVQRPKVVVFSLLSFGALLLCFATISRSSIPDSLPRFSWLLGSQTADLTHAIPARGSASASDPALVLPISPTGATTPRSATASSHDAVSVNDWRAVGEAPVKRIRRAVIVTCPQCRLNSLPSVKVFVMEHAKVFEPNLKVDFVVGKDPYLFLYENDREMEAIDLSVRDMLYPLLG
jgi:hypothetical protein